MSLFKERSINAKKLISLENTITALKNQITLLKGSSSQLLQLQEIISTLQEENKALKTELEKLSQKTVIKKKPGRKKSVSKEILLKEDT
jgi:regulator of replication initiation timing